MLRLPRARAAGTRSWTIDDCLLASERVNARARRSVLAGCRDAGPARLGPPRASGLPAQPRRPRGPAHRQLQVRLVTSAGRARRRRARRRRRLRRRCCWTQTDGVGESTQRRRDGAPRRRAERLEEELGGLRFRDLARGVLPDQHRDGRAALRRRRRVRRAERPRARLRPLLRHRHDRPVAGRRAPARSWGVEIVEAGGRRRDRQRARSTRSTTRTSSPATCAWRCASSSSAPAARTSSWSTRRAPACRRRSCAGSSRPRRSGSSTSPATRRRWRRTPRQLVEAGYALRARAAGRHVPADAAHRVRRAAHAMR